MPGKVEEAPKDEPTDDPTDDADDDKLEEKVELIVKQLLKSTPRKAATSGGRTAPDPDAIADEVRRELENVRKGESADAERRSLLDRLTNLEKAATETKPVLSRRIEKIMGWVRDDDK